MNVTPTSEQEVNFVNCLYKYFHFAQISIKSIVIGLQAATAAALMNVTMPPKVMVNDDQTTALNETVNTEAFGSPKSDLFTSSPNGNNDTMGLNNERDVNVINVSLAQFGSDFILPSGIEIEFRLQHLNMARQSIEQALLTMKLNVTRCLTQDVAAAASAGLLSTTTQELPPNNGNRNRTAAPQLPRMLNGRNASQVAANNGNLIIIMANMLKSTDLIALFIMFVSI